jgi:hypothetical protein
MLRKLVGLAGLAACLSLAPSGRADSNSRADLPVSFSTAHVKDPPVNPVLLVETRLDPVTFALTAFEGKYRIVRVEVENRTNDRIDLDAASDKFVAQIDPNKTASGVLDLSVADGTLWDKIDKERRKLLAYPKTIERKARVSVYVFFPRDQLPDIPASFEWKVADGSRTFQLHRPPPTKK